MTLYSIETQALENITLTETLDRQLAKLPDDYTRLVVILHAMGVRQYEIAEVVGVEKQTISWMVQSAIRRFGKD